MSVQDSLVLWLKSLSEADHDALSAARPGAGITTDPHELAERLLDQFSVIEAVGRLSTPQLQVLEVVQVLGDGCLRHDVTVLLDVPDAGTEALLGQVLDQLARIALVWPDGDRLRLGPATAWLETRAGGPLGAGLPLDALLPDLPSGAMREIALNLGLNLGDAAHRDQLMALLARTLRDRDLVRSIAARAPARTGAILTRLASFGLPGSPGTALDAIEPRAIAWAAERGLVIMDDFQLAMPREVRLALRGPDYRAPFEPVPPRPDTTPAALRPAEAANAATRAVELTEAILHSCAATPLTALKSGGVGARQLRRLAKATGCAQTPLRLLLEIAGEAGLLAWERDIALPTARFDGWLAASTADRLGALLDAWWRLERLPLFDDDGKPWPCLDPDAVEPYAPTLRAAFVRTTTTLPPGHAVTGSDALVPGTLWRLPLTFEDPADAGAYAATLWDEASVLGVVADGRPSPLAQGLVDGRVASSVEELFAGQVTTALFQNDLTVVVTGLPSLAMSELFDTVADREARGAASIWRFSPDSVRRGFDRGQSARTLTDDLAALSRSGELPNVLTRLIDDVARRHGEVRVVEAGCCLRVPEPPLAAELVRARGLAKLRLREIAPGVLVSVLDPAATLTLLRQAGYVPAADAQDGTPFVDRSARRARTR